MLAIESVGSKMCIACPCTVQLVRSSVQACSGAICKQDKLLLTLRGQRRRYLTTSRQFTRNLTMKSAMRVMQSVSHPSATVLGQPTKSKTMSLSSSANLSTANAQPKGDYPLPFEDIPGPKGIRQLPILGAIMLFKPFTEFTPAKAHLMFDNLFEQYGPVVRCNLRSPTVLIREVNDIETVFRNEGNYPRRPSLELPIQFAKRNNFKKGFNEVQGEEWHKLRSPLNKRMARVNSASCYMLEQNKVAVDFRDILENGAHMTPEELSDIFFRFAAESIGVVCFNSRIGFLDSDHASRPDTMEYLSASKAVFRLLHDEMRGRSVMHRVYRNKTYKEFEAAQLTLKHYSGRELQRSIADIKERQAGGSFDPEEPNLLISLLNDPALDFEDIRILMNTLYVAGTDSTAKNLQVFLYILATHPDKQETLYKEIIDLIGPDDPLTPEALAKMSYLKAALKESFRLNFPNMAISRFLPTDVVLSGYRVPAGVQVIICSPSVSKAYFDNHDQYMPERWLRSQDGRRRETDIHPMSNLPFGHGPRNCIGRRFAEQELYLATVKILQKLKVGVKKESEKTSFIYSIFVEPEKPIAFTFTRR